MFCLKWKFELQSQVLTPIHLVGWLPFCLTVHTSTEAVKRHPVKLHVRTYRCRFTFAGETLRANVHILVCSHVKLYFHGMSYHGFRIASDVLRKKHGAMHGRYRRPHRLFNSNGAAVSCLRAPWCNEASKNLHKRRDVFNWDDLKLLTFVNGRRLSPLICRNSRTCRGSETKDVGWQERATQRRLVRRISGIFSPETFCENRQNNV